MGLAEVQTALARLFTEPEMRSRFDSDPLSVAALLRLSREEACSLAKVSVQLLEHYATSLRRKRCNDAQKILPLTHRLLGREFAPLFMRYLEQASLPVGPVRAIHDALGFTAFLRGRAAASTTEPPYVADLAAYEAARRVAATPGRHCFMRVFRYPVAQLAAASWKGAAVDAYTRPRRTFALWIRLSKQGPSWHVLYSLPLNEGTVDTTEGDHGRGCQHLPPVITLNNDEH
jgi:hypothetical protein